MVNQKAKLHALAALDRSISKHETFLKKSHIKSRRQCPLGKQRDRSDHVEVLPGTLAHADTRRAASEYLINSLLTQHAKTKGSRRRTFLATFAWDEGIVPVDQTKLPLLKPLFQKVYKALMEFGLSGVIVIDFSLFDPEDIPPYIHIHFHAICWTYDKQFRHSSASKALCKRRAFKNLRFKSVNIRSRKEAANLFPFKDSPLYTYVFKNLHKDQTKASIAWLGQYLWAAPAATKRVVMDHETSKGRIVNFANSENAERLHLEVERLMAQLPVQCCIAGVDAGCAIRREWKKKMREWTGRSIQADSSNRAPRISKARHLKKKRRNRSSRLLNTALQAIHAR